MNIAIMIPQLHGGGSEKIARYLGEHLSEQGETIYYFVRKYRKSDINKKSGKIIKLHIGEVANAVDMDVLFSELSYQAEIIKGYKRKYQIDVSISFLEEFNYLNILSKDKEFVITRIGTVLSERYDYAGAFYDGNHIQKMYAQSDLVIVQSHDGKAELEHIYNVPVDKIKIIPNPVTKLPEREEVLDDVDSKSNIIMVGRLHPIKQHSRMLRSFKYILSHKPDARLYIVGGGEIENKLKKLAEDLEVSVNVCFCGYQDRVDSYLKKSSVYVMTSKCEGFPNSMLEAMSVGLPIVSSDAPGGIRDILGGNVDYLLSREGFRLRKYGICSPQMTENIFDADLPITLEEVGLGNAILEVLENGSLNALLREKSLERAGDYNDENVMMLWKKIIYEGREKMMNKVAIPISAGVGAMVGASLENHKITKELECQRELADKHLKLYLMMNQWVKWKQEGRNLSEFLVKRGHKRIAIYGMNYAGERLFAELKDSPVDVIYGIDRSADEIYADIPIVKPDADFDHVDAVVVTAITYFDDIEEFLYGKIDCPIYSLEDMFYD